MRNQILFFYLIGAVFSTSSKIGTSLNKILNTAESANIFVTFASQNEQVYQTMDTQSFSNRAQKIDFLATNLQTQAQSTQQNVVNFLRTQATEYKSFWISNKIFIPNANKSLIGSLANFPEVVKIEDDIIIQLEATIETAPEPQQSAPWSIQKIQATNAWNITRGEGVVVANIDSGVLYTHEVLRHNFRANYGWYDAYVKSTTPNDLFGLGTFTMGTLAGRNGIGVAPESTWIACKGCWNGHCHEYALLDCGQWILCPTRPDGSQQNCSMAPHVVSNSWGDFNLGNNSWYDDTIKAWVQAGIIPVFSIGNLGPNCSTVASPGDRPGVIGVGSTNSTDAIYTKSSVGPTADGRIKPDIVAPGSYIRTASYKGNTLYTTITGTVMSAPHVAGTIALMLSKTKGLSFQEVKQILETTVDTNLTSRRAMCGITPDYYFPNNHFGNGRLNAFKAVKSVPFVTTIGTTHYPDGTSSTTTLGITTTAISLTTTSGTTTPQSAKQIVLTILCFFIVSVFYKSL